MRRTVFGRGFCSCFRGTPFGGGTAVGCLAITVVACHEIAPLSPPPTDGAASLLLVVTQGETFELAFAVPLEPEPDYPVFSRPPSVRIDALTFACPLDVLGLEAGSLVLEERPAAPFARTTRPRLPPPTSIFTSNVNANVQDDWIALPEMDTPLWSVLARLPVREDNLCRLYGTSAFPGTAPFGPPSEPPSAPQFLVKDQSDVGLLGTVQGQFYRVGPGEVMSPLNLPVDMPHGAAFRRSEDETWVVGTDGVIARGTIERGFDLLNVRTSTIYRAIRVDGARGNAPDEVFLVSSTGYLERFDGDRWTVVSVPARPRFPGSTSHDVAWIGPGEAIATGIGEEVGDIVHFRLGHPIEVSRLADGTGRPVSIGHFPAVGTVVGTAEGNIAFLESDEEGDDGSSRWRTVPPAWPPDPNRSLRVQVFGRGFGDILFGMIYFARYHPLAGSCPLDFETIEADEMIDLADGTHLFRPFPSFEFPRNWGITTMRTRSRLPPCLAGSGSTP